MLLFVSLIHIMAPHRVIIDIACATLIIFHVPARFARRSMAADRTEVSPIMRIGCNGVIAQATESEDGISRIFLITPADAWTKQLTIHYRQWYFRARA